MLEKNGVEISIITPVYNGIQFVDSARDSVINQTFTDFEWILIDDCSTDGSLEALNKLAGEDPRIKVVCHEENKGPIHARNSGFEVAGGRYIAFLDIDDCWTHDKLEKQLEFMKEKKAGLSYTAYSRITMDGGRISSRTIEIPERVNTHSILCTCSIMASSAMFDLSMTGPIMQDVTAPHKDDLHLWVRILEKVGYAYGLDERLSLLRVHNSSFTGNKLKEAHNQWIFYRRSLKMPLSRALFFYMNYAVKGTLKYIALKYLS